jgi:hypothetical protein
VVAAEARIKLVGSNSGESCLAFSDDDDNDDDDEDDDD